MPCRPPGTLREKSPALGNSVPDFSLFMTPPGVLVVVAR